MLNRLIKRLKSWGRTGLKLVLLGLGYFWLGAAYKLFYAQTHDLTRFKSQLPLSFYQQQFILESLLHQNWMFGPDFREYIGAPPSVRALTSANPQAVLAVYCREREQELSTLPSRYPYSLFTEHALEDAYLMSQGAALLGTMTAREKPVRGLATPGEDGAWRTVGVPELYRSGDLARRLADEYPTSPQAPTALLRVAQMEAQQGHSPQSEALYQRLILEYPQVPEAEAAANALAGAAREAGRLSQTRALKQQALDVSEQAARKDAPGQPLPVNSAFKVLGYRIDLAEVELQLRELKPAQEALTLANRETHRLHDVPGLEKPLRDELNGTQSRLDRVRDEAWVADLFNGLKIGAPGPPPRPHEYAVSGQVVLGQQPLAGVEVVLVEAHGNNHDLNPMTLGWLNQSRYRAFTDARGQYKITAVPAGNYSVNMIYPLRPSKNLSIVPAQVAYGHLQVKLIGRRVAAGSDQDAVPHPPSDFSHITITNKNTTLPIFRFQPALETRAFGELPPDGNGVRLEWQAWPGAAAYRVAVLAAPNNAAAFDYRVPPPQRAQFAQRPLLWHLDKTATTQVTCPLLALAPDRPQGARVAQYEYEVTALNREGQPVATSATPFCRFLLSPEACVTLLKLKPPTRRTQRHPRGFWGGPRRGTGGH